MRFSALAHRDHAVCNPIGLAKLDRMLARLDLPPGARVLDAGCGKAEALIRVLEATDARGVGVDPNPAFMAEARARATARGVAGRLELLEMRMADAGLGEGAFDAALCVGSTHAFGDLRAALAALVRFVRPGGTLLVGDAYWRQFPVAEYLVALGARREDHLHHAGNVAAGVEAGLRYLCSAVASEDDWDEYEGLYNRAIEEFVREHPDDPDAAETRSRIRAWRDAYLAWGRDTLGFGLYLFRR